eukprot:14025115-Heterocapsa_arctica.AAC.1
MVFTISGRDVDVGADADVNDVRHVGLGDAHVVDPRLGVVGATPRGAGVEVGVGRGERRGLEEGPEELAVG